MFVKRTPNLASACYNILKIITRHGKSPSDGYYIKKTLGWNVYRRLLFEDVVLFEDFPNDDKSSSADFADSLN